MMQEAPATPRRRSASDDDAFADADKYDDLEEAQQLLAAENGEKIKKKAPPRNLFGLVVMLASGVAVASVTSNTSRRVVGQWGGAGGACCEDHFALAGRL